ncbi:MAG: N-acetylmuramoyl-L-alanine amidase [Bacteroidales bacterium]|jgi:N-acetylmuramoyl-L-alanine amidase|nr:N-acetylmuramoyl-L-alanine amidase [Bacteroidales bacterium]
MKRLQILVLILVLFWGNGVVFGGNPIKVIVLDAGHGGKDPGAVGTVNSFEKTVTLAVVLKVEQLLKEKYPHIKVLQTRSSDTYVALKSRTAFANTNHADLFISIHCNSSESASAKGAEVYVMGLDKENANLNVAKAENASILMEKNYENNYEGFDPNSPETYIIFSLYQNLYLHQSIHLASLIMSEFRKQHRIDRGVRQAGFLVLWRATMPSILIETGFISNAEEEAYLTSEKGQNEIATAVFNALSKIIEEGNESKATTTANVDTVVSKPQQATVENQPIQKTVTPTAIDSNIPTKEVQNQPVVEKNNPPAPPQKADTTPIVKPKPVIKEAPQQAEVYYRVRFFSSKIDFAVEDKRFGDLPEIAKTYNGEYYRYTSGKFNRYSEAVAHLAVVKKTFPDAFIIAQQSKDDKLISVTEAKEIERKSTKQ